MLIYQLENIMGHYHLKLTLPWTATEILLNTEGMASPQVRASRGHPGPELLLMSKLFPRTSHPLSVSAPLPREMHCSSVTSHCSTGVPKTALLRELRFLEHLLSGKQLSLTFAKLKG